MHALASHLKTTVHALERGMSAREFIQWCAWMDEEQVGPAWDRIRHAQALAAIYNGPHEREGGGMFTAGDFLPKDEPEEQTDAERVAEEFRLAFSAMNWAGTKGVLQ